MNPSDKQRIIQDYRAARKDYAPLPAGDIFFDGDERAEECKRIVAEHLDPAEQNFIYLYAEMKSFSAIGRLLGISHPSVSKEVRRIKEKVVAEYERRLKEGRRK